ncbi:hypothetical protein EV198_2831 [Roseivirga ehrenbergii]|uniref:Uncharacterized protein n=1 Tax=Roseivirga ehrenbergii (strain DSM 102268 / JCM 13514 / KCTC 12282 / NCIMB 14502 / KMM 6017) TaxID=279360 RepID=A0A150XQN9_ROSEK|nr:hypothetical protein MB14_14310 [Roseivirga ehrenbergii]TCL00815.1 hypothetical protein EV198_2831 [Roseivirga ehrenbergii]
MSNRKKQNNNLNNTVMNSSKVKTQKNLSALLGLALAVITLFQAGSVKSNESSDRSLTSIEEAELRAEIDSIFPDDGLTITERAYAEIEAEQTNYVKVFNANNELVAQGITTENEELRRLVNQADFLIQVPGQKYYRISE